MRQIKQLRGKLWFETHETKAQEIWQKFHDVPNLPKEKKIGEAWKNSINKTLYLKMALRYGRLSTVCYTEAPHLWRPMNMPSTDTLQIQLQGLLRVRILDNIEHFIDLIGTL